MTAFGAAAGTAKGGTLRCVCCKSPPRMLGGFDPLGRSHRYRVAFLPAPSFQIAADRIGRSGGRKFAALRRQHLCKSHLRFSGVYGAVIRSIPASVIE